MRWGRVAGAVLAAALASSSMRGAAADEPAPKPSAVATASAEGTPVTFESKSASTVIYLAHGEVPSRADPDPFERIGVAPLTVRLAPGTYTVETEGPTQSTGHQRLVVEHDAPFTVEVHPGDASLKLVGGALIALGVVSILLGIVAIVSISKDDSGYDRWGIGLPLGIGGAAGTAVGLGLSAMGSTDVYASHLPPGNAAHPAAFVPTLTVAF